MTSSNDDPNMHWDGTRWLRWSGTHWYGWDGTAWVAVDAAPAPRPERASPSAPQPGPDDPPQPEPQPANTGSERPDIEQAVDRMGFKIGSNREIRKLNEHLWPGEHVDSLAGGEYGEGRGLVVLTNQRLLFVYDAWTSQQVEDFPLEKISSIQWETGLVHGTVTIFASGNQAVITSVPKDDGADLTTRARHLLATRSDAPYPAAVRGAAGQEDPMATMTKLGQLHDAGLISDQEFIAKRAEVLRRM